MLPWGGGRQPRQLSDSQVIQITRTLPDLISLLGHTIETSTSTLYQPHTPFSLHWVTVWFVNQIFLSKIKNVCNCTDKLQLRYYMHQEYINFPQSLLSSALHPFLPKASQNMRHYIDQTEGLNKFYSFLDDAESVKDKLNQYVHCFKKCNRFLLLCHIS